MKLVIVESPTKAKTLGGILSKKDYEIEASMGHVRDLPKKGLAIDVENNFTPSYEVPEKSKKVISVLKKLSKDADEIILATDPDREGEAIAWHLKELLDPLGKKKLKFERVIFHELTDGAISEAFAHPIQLNLNLVDAQQARRVLDRLVGYKLSPILWKKVGYGLSAGRVQSVAVRLIVERERERQAFNSIEYWSIDGEFHTSDNRKIKAKLEEFNSKKLEIKTFEQTQAIENELRSDSFRVLEVKKTQRKRNPYAPLKTSTLQQSAANAFGMSAKATMSAAQKLFEEGYITYHRTDSINLSVQFITEARGFIKSQFGPNFCPAKPVSYKNTGKNAQEAHEAIRPTNIKTLPGTIGKGKLGEYESKVYSLIWKRSLESQILPALYDQTLVSIASKKGYLFKASGSVIKFEGWLTVGKFLGLEIDIEDMQKLDELAENETLMLKDLKSNQHFTQPPPRYSDATLIKSLEDLGIGRPSTYAPTITTIQARGYVRKENKYFVPEDVSFVVIDLLVNNFSEIVDYRFTAQMEQKLDEIAEGSKEWVPVMKEFYAPFEKNIEEKDKILRKADVTNLGESEEKCPECGKSLVIKLGKYGKFLSCSDYPECKFAKPIEAEVSETGEEQADYGKCPKCEEGIFILKQGRFGKFLACSNYPKCKTTEKYLEKIGVICPKCTKGDVVVKKSKKGIFYGCSNYPDCDFSSWTKPER